MHYRTATALQYPLRPGELSLIMHFHCCSDKNWQNSWSQLGTCTGFVYPTIPDVTLLTVL